VPKKYVEDINRLKEELPDSRSGNLITNALVDALEAFVLTAPNVATEYVIIPITDFITALSGMLMDNSMEFTIFRSLGDNNTNPLTTFDSSIKEIWRMIRDGINIVFIFTLLYIAIQRILGDFKKNIFVGVLASAVFVNFSFFATRTIIDIGNIFTGEIYNQIEIKVDDFKITDESTITNLTSKFFRDSKTQTKLSTIIRNITGIDALKDAAPIYSMEALISNMVVLITSLILVFVYLYMSFLFIGRFVMLIFLMASSPIGFLFGSIPKIASYTSKWWDTLLKQIAVAPIFMFFILMVVNISQNQALKTARTGGLGIGLFFNYILIISTLITALKISKNLSGQVASLAGKATSFVAGAALGAVTGGTAMLGRQFVGRKAAKLASGSIGASLQQRAAKGGIRGGLANLALEGIKGTANASFDIRGLKTFQKAAAQTKSLSGGAIDIKGALDSVGNFGKASGSYGKDKKGFTGWKEKQEENVAKKSQEYDETANKIEKAAELKAQNKYKVIEKRLEEKEAKKALDEAENDLATANTADRATKETERNILKMEYLAKKGAREIAEQNTINRIKNDAETRFEDDRYVSETSDINKKNYRAAQEKIKNVRQKQTDNKKSFDATTKSEKDKEKYNKEEVKLQEELKAAVEEMEKAKTEGIKSQEEIVKQEILRQNKPEDQDIIKIIKSKQMRSDYAEQLKKQWFTLNQFSRIGFKNLKGDFEETEREELAKIVVSDKGTSKAKSDEEKTMAALLKQLEKLNDKK